MSLRTKFTLLVALWSAIIVGVIYFFFTLSFGYGEAVGYNKGRDRGLEEGVLTAEYAWLQCIEDDCRQAKAISKYIAKDLQERKRK